MYQVDDEDDDDFDYSTSYSKSLEFEKALHSPTISPTTSCKDDWTFRFKIDSGKKRGCFWLKKNNAVERQKKWCSLKHIMTGCKSTCGFCDCKESEFFFFEKKMGNPAACKWLREKEIRRERYCYIGRHSNYDTAPVSSIAMNCPISCKLCQADESPDEGPPSTPSSPTKTPTFAPTKSYQPTSSSGLLQEIVSTLYDGINTSTFQDAFTTTKSWFLNSANHPSTLLRNVNYLSVS